MKKKLLVGLVLACAMALPLAFTACGDTGDGGDNNGGGNNVMDQVDPTWKKAIEDFCAESGIANSDVMTEMQIFVANYSSFTLANGKYTAASIASVNGFVCKNIEIVMDGSKIVSVSYELRTSAATTPDRLVTIDKDGVHKTEIPKPTDDEKMDEDEWDEQATVFANVTNYTLRRDSVETGELAGAMKLDGTTYYETTGLSEGIYETVGGKFYHYYRNAFSSQWFKEEVESSEYERSVQVPSSMVTVAAKAVQENFSEFEFDAGLYKAEELTVEYFGMDFTLRDMQITISGGKIVRAECVLVDGYWGDGDERITVYDLGSTEIVYPTTFTDKTQSGGEGGTPGGEGGEGGQGGQTTSGEVIEKVWDTAFGNVDNYMVTASMHITSGTHSTNISLEGCLDGNKYEQTQSTDGQISHVIVENVDGRYIEYSETDEGEWVRMDWNKLQPTLEGIFEQQVYLLRTFVKQYSEFSYTERGYTCPKLSYMQGLLMTNIIVRFENGSLVYVTFTMGNGEDAQETFTFTDFGKAEVQIPDDYTEYPEEGGSEGGEGGEQGGEGGEQGNTPGGSGQGSEGGQGGNPGGEQGGEGGQGDPGRPQIDDATWNELFSSITGYTYTTVQNNGDGFSRFEVRVQGETLELRIEEDGAAHVIFTVEDGKYVEYGEMDGKWYRSVIEDKNQEETQVAIAFRSLPLELLADQFGEFRAEGIEYHCDELKLLELNEKFGSPLYDILVRIPNGKLETIVFQIDVGDEHQEFTVVNINETEIELPKEYENYVPGGEEEHPAVGEVDEATWSEVFSNVNNFRYHATVKASMPTGEPFESYIDETFDRDKFEQTVDDGTETTHVIVAKENDRYVQYSETDDGLWRRMDHDGMQEDLEMVFMSQNSILPLFADQFDQFQYEEGQYVCADLAVAEGRLHLLNVVVCFEDGALISVSCATDMGEMGSEDFAFSDFGNVKVEIPEDYTDVPEQAEEGITAEIWDSEIDRVGTNYTFTSPYEDENTTETRYALRDGDNFEQISKKENGINNTWLRDIKEGDAYTEYTSSDGVEWIKRQFTAEVEDVQVALSAFSDPLQGLKGHFDDFIFENGKYICKELTLTVEGEETIFDWFQVVFEGDTIVSVTFQRFGEVQYTYTDLGETTVEAPTEYVNEEDLRAQGPTVKEAAWNAAVKNASNFTIDMSTSGKMWVDGNKIMVSVTYESMTMWQITVAEGDKATVYYSTDGNTWTKAPDNVPIANVQEMINSTHAIVNMLKGRYNDFTYQEEDGKYVCPELVYVAGEQDNGVTDVEVVFKDGKFVSISCSSKDADGNDITITVTDFGTTEVEVPTI